MSLNRITTEGNVGGLNTATAQTVAANTATTVFSTTKPVIVEINNVGNAGGFFKIGTSVSGDVAADTGAYIASNGTTRPFVLPANNVIKANVKINVVVVSD